MVFSRRLDKVFFSYMEGTDNMISSVKPRRIPFNPCTKDCNFGS